KEVLAWTRKFIDTPALARDHDFLAQLISLLSDGLDREGHDDEKRGDAKECGRSFLAAADVLPTHAKHAERLWNAGQCFQNAHLVGQAIRAWDALIKAHPADTLARRAVYRIGAGYQQLAFYEQAATHYED